MELTAECTLVASGRLGFGISSPWDAHAYLLCEGDEAVLVDTGCGREPEAMTARVEAALRGAQLRAILITHTHVDHSGGAAALSAHFGAPVLASPRGCEILRRGDEEAIGLPGAREVGIYPPDQRLDPVPDARPAEAIRFGKRTITPVPTPGHSADHLVFVADLAGGTALFSGDLLFAQGRVAILDTADTDTLALAESLRTIERLAPTQLFPGHGAVVLNDAGVHIRSALAAFDRGEQPPPLVP